MTDDEHVKLLRAIRELALVPYRYADGANNDPHLVMALGQIAGLASAVISNFTDRKITPRGKI